jgi:hypothetical protein
MILNIKELGIDIKIQSTINLLTNVINKKDSNEFEIWKAYSWLEYCILLIRLKQYDLLDKIQQNVLKPKKKKEKVEKEANLKSAREILKSLDYTNNEHLLNSLRESRDLLKIYLKTDK